MIDSLTPADLVVGSGVMLSSSSVMLVLTQVLCCAALSSFHVPAELAARDPEWFEKIDSLTPADLVAVAEEFTKAQVGKVQHGEQQLFICSVFRQDGAVTAWHIAKGCSGSWAPQLYLWFDKSAHKEQLTMVSLLTVTLTVCVHLFICVSCSR
jgi:hypothetical protein